MVLCWAGNFIVGKIALREWSPLPLALVRVSIAATILLLLYALRRRPRAAPAVAGPNTGTAATRSARFARRDWLKFIELGLYGVALNQVLFTVGLNYTTVAHSSLVISLSPIVVLILTRLRGLEELTGLKILGVGLAFLGVTILVLERGLSLHAGTLRGDLITFFGTFAFALYTVAGKEVSRRYDSLALNAFTFLAGALIVLPVGLAALLRFDWSRLSWHGWAAMLYMAVFASVVAYLIYYEALRIISASRVIAFSYLHPVLVTLGGVIILAEPLTMHVVMGGAIVLLGVYLAERNNR